MHLPNNYKNYITFKVLIHLRHYTMNHLPVVYIGYKPGEDERILSTTASYKEAIPDVTVDYPLFSVIGRC